MIFCTRLLEGERSWAGSSAFYIALAKLKIPSSIYELSLPHIFSPQELHYYLDSLENELRGKQNCEAKLYLTQRINVLRKWATDGLVVHAVS